MSRRRHRRGPDGAWIFAGKQREVELSTCGAPEPEPVLVIENEFAEVWDEPEDDSLYLYAETMIRAGRECELSLRARWEYRRYKAKVFGWEKDQVWAPDEPIWYDRSPADVDGHSYDYDAIISMG